MKRETVAEHYGSFENYQRHELKRLIEIFTDENDVVIDPCAGSGSTLRAAAELNRSAYGFEIDRTFYKRATEEMLNGVQGGETIVFEQTSLF